MKFVKKKGVHPSDLEAGDVFTSFGAPMICGPNNSCTFLGTGEVVSTSGVSPDVKVFPDAELHLDGTPENRDDFDARQTSSLIEQVGNLLDCLRHGEKIQAIKQIRAITGMGVCDAKEMIERAPLDPFTRKDTSRLLDADSINVAGILHEVGTLSREISVVVEEVPTEGVHLRDRPPTRVVSHAQLMSMDFLNIEARDSLGKSLALVLTLQKEEEED